MCKLEGEDTNTTCAVGVTESTASSRDARRGLRPTAALQSLRVKPIPFTAAKRILERNHYLHSMPGGTKLAFGVFFEGRLEGAITFGSGPANAYKMVSEASPSDCLTLSRLWLSDSLPSNSESRVLGVTLRALRKHTKTKFVISYADPSQGHLGTIYQATGWVYTGLSLAMPMFDIGDGKPRHSRSLSHSFGSHSIKHFNSHGVEVRVIPQSHKHRYFYFLDKEYKGRLRVEPKSYPKKKGENG
ncbi:MULTISPECIES: hypothetical protein [Dehalococcoides]|jgi:hypothetical protein|uniref:DNA modification protein n=4 Tax=root TaxID=1 RepID=D2BJ86_DEHMV|nr:MULTISPECIES: hypothetical protein [Dehalococcoides]AEI59436.1 Mom [Dehalococcoides sp. enrichment culture clone WBC-2_Dhc_01]AEI59458.1 Mom [Dehalococcoides sp. enrichment culture clone WL_Dhc_01]ACZ62386.1 DNA modification protein [Dehalococcoides mccartyi VS]AOV99938.1 protein mom [Dehalococcoides mccartyi]AQX73741.1 DNA methyltransferase [Dehalococcoides mccartyi]